MDKELLEIQEYFDKNYPRKKIDNFIGSQMSYVPDITLEWALSKLTPKFLESLHDVIDPYLVQNFGEEVNIHLNLTNKLLTSPLIDDLELPRIMMISYPKIANVLTKEIFVYKLVDNLSSIPDDYKKCSYCNGYTKNDQRGNCLAYGGPRGSL